MVERMRARHSATFLFGAQAKAGVWPVGCQQVKNIIEGHYIELHRDKILFAYLLHLLP